MRNFKPFSALLAAVALALSFQSCRPAWHPSGKIIAFPFIEAPKGGIAFYSTETGSIQKLRDPKYHLSGSQCLWSSDGKYLFADALLEDRSIGVLRLSPSSRAIDTVAVFKGVSADSFVRMQAILPNDRYIWIGAIARERPPGEPKLDWFYARIDLTDGRVDEFGHGQDMLYVLYDFGKRGLFCVCEPYWDAPTYSSQSRKPPIQLRSFDGATGATKALFSLPEEPVMGLAAEPDGSRFSAVVERDRAQLLLILNANGAVEKKIPLPVEVAWTGLCATWIGDHIWVPVAMMRNTREAGFLRVNVSSGSTTFVALGRCGMQDEGSGLEVCGLQLAPSPDGTKAAASYAPPGSDGRQLLTQLFIFDLAVPDKAPTVISVPPDPSKEATPASTDSSLSPAD